MENFDIAVIGAGAAGLAAGVFAGEAARAAAKAIRIVLLDGAKTIGAKILVSGGGRCNVTHDQIQSEDYHASRVIVRNVLAAFDERQTVEWMQSLGIQLKREPTGKLFPTSDSARSVLAALLARLQDLGVEVRTGWRVTDVEPLERSRNPQLPDSENARHSESRPITQRESRPASFLIRSPAGQIVARQMILATGGRSLPRTGSDGAGYGIARSLGHSVSATFPALVPLVLENDMFHAEVSGLSHEAELSTFVDGKRADVRRGSLLWTHFGISGPVAMDASRFWTMNHTAGACVEMRCSFLPGESFDQVEKWLLAAGAARPRVSLGRQIADRLPERLADALIRRAGADPAQPLAQLSREHRRQIVHALTALSLPVARDRGWNYAEVTAGGVPLHEIDFRTMHSRKTPGLFLIGELLDCDGRIGGFNFQWAWSTAHIAGRAAVARHGSIQS